MSALHLTDPWLSPEIHATSRSRFVYIIKMRNDVKNLKHFLIFIRYADIVINMAYIFCGTKIQTAHTIVDKESN